MGYSANSETNGASRVGLNWRAILATAPLGLLFGVLTVMGVIPDAAGTQRLALVFLGVLGVAVGLRVPDRPFLHGLVAGFVAGLIAIEIQAIFLTTYFANNPQWANLEMPFGWPPRVVTAVLGPLNAVVAAAIGGAVAWTASRARGAWARHTRSG